jgi:HPt (histidine-containing phosphotransfer) domain-containing protein
MLNTYLNPRVLIGLAVAIIVGLIVGFATAWNIPASDTAPIQLQQGYREFYLALVADQYSRTHNLDQAQTELGANNVKDRGYWSSDQVIKDLRKLAGAQGRADAAQLTALADALEKRPAPAAQPAAGGPNWPLVICSAVILILLIVAFVVLVLPRLREAAPKPPPSAAVRGAQATKAVEVTTWAGEAEKPLAQFVTTYELGDDRYDTSFSIETSTGDFLGECGVGISETIGTGSPDKVTAFEVWLFDKNDIRTVTKVLMSEYAYGDTTLRTKLAPKGEPELARPEAAVELETATLRVRARVVEMEYGLGELPERSFFNKLALELATWPKEAPATAPALEPAPAA